MVANFRAVWLWLFVLCVGLNAFGAADNLIANGDFRAKDPEQRPLRWVVSKGPQTALVTRKEHHGLQQDDSSLEFVVRTNQVVLIRSEKHVANPGTLYVAKAWVKATNGVPPGLFLEFWDQNGVRTNVASVAPGLATTWQGIEVSNTCPNQATHVSVAIGSLTNGAGVSYWDDVSLVPQIAYDGRLETGVRELFLDDYRLDSLVDVQRVVHPGKKSSPLISPTEPWEGRAVYLYGTVLKEQPEGSGYRVWYTAFNGEYYLCYATSTDGLTWHKPNLGIVDFKGSKENNITLVGGGSLIFDPDDRDPARRYKLMNYSAAPKDKAGYWVYFSPDGLHWTPYAGNPVIPYGDVASVAYDRHARLFIASTKQRMLISNTSVTPNKQDRAAFVSVSTNFTDWFAPGAPQARWTLAVEGDSADDFRAMARGGLEAQIYGMPIYPYEKIYIGLPWVFDIMNYNAGIYAATGDGPIQPQIAASRDLRHWSRPAREPVLPLGRAGAWDDSTLYTANTLLVSSNEMEIYYGAMNLPHGAHTATQVQTARIAKATWRRDGFVSLHNAGDDPGVVTTKTIVFTGASQLAVNAKLTTDGSLKIEILDDAGVPLPGFALSNALPLIGDQLSGIIRWSGVNDLRDLAGQPIKLRFHLKGGDLYSYSFTP